MQNLKLTRRDALKAAGAAALTSVAGIKASSAGDDSFVYSSWGGEWQKALEENWFKPFTAETGIKVIVAGPPDYGKIEAMVTNNAIEWDVAEVLSDFTIIGEEKKLLEPIDFSVVDKSSVPDADIWTATSVPQVLFSYMVTYRKDKFPDEHPENWADVWNVEKFPGKRTFMRYANFGVFEAALLADGVSKDKVYPLDIDRALRKLDQIKGETIWFESGSQMTQLFSDGSVSCGMGWDGRICTIAKEVPVAFGYDQSLISYSSMVIPKGAKNKAAAMKFLAWAVGKSPQAKIAEAICYGPVNPQAFESLPEGVRASLSGNAAQRPVAVFMNTRYWAEHLAEVQQKFDDWLAS